MTRPDTSVSIELGGRQLFLHFSLAALERARQALGLPTLAALLRKSDEMVASIQRTRQQLERLVEAGTEGDAVPGDYDGYTAWEIDSGALAALLWSGLHRCWREMGERPPSLEDFAEDLVLADTRLVGPLTLAITRSHDPGSIPAPPAASPETEAGADADDPPGTAQAA